MHKKYDTNPLAVVSESPIHGRGLFARMKIEPDTLIGEYVGAATQTDDMHVLWVWNEQSNTWEGLNGNNEMRFLNHSNKPNAEFCGTELYALRDISTGEEITFDYQGDEE